jgi:agmatine/peptidylarginine deiminase
MQRLLRLFLVPVFFLVAPVRAQQDAPEKEPLPRGLTPAERALLPSYVPPPTSPAVAPPGPVRAMAEFEELEGIVVRWAYGTYNTLLSQIVDAAQDEGTVWILVRPGTSDSSNIKNYLSGRGIPLTNLEFLSVSTNSVWSRDYGPWTVYRAGSDSMAIVDFRYNRPRPLDDAVPGFLASRWGLPLYHTAALPDSLVFTGGNFMVDGFGTGFASRLVNDENLHLDDPGIDTILSRYCGLTRFVKMPTLQYDEIHHIDMHMKLLDEETLLIGEYPPGQGDHARIEETVDSLRMLQSCYGRPYRIVRIPMPADASGAYPPASYYLTYTNSLIVNRTVLVPVYGRPEDAQALQIYRDAMPGYRVVGYDCNAIIPANGTIHCITKEVGVRQPLLIAHARRGDATAGAMEYPVEVRLSTSAAVESVLVCWRSDTLGAFTRLPLAPQGDAWAGAIPRRSPGSRVWYYIDVRTTSGRTVTKPLVGPDGPYTFSVGPPVTAPLAVGEGWNLLSLPVAAPQDSVLQVFPNAVSPAYTFDPAQGYVPLSTLAPGTGFWLKFNGPDTVSTTGVPRDRDTLAVHAGWNLVGALHVPIPVSSLGSLPPGNLLSPFFEFSGSYAPADTLRSGQGYWVKAADAGRIVLSAP